MSFKSFKKQFLDLANITTPNNLLRVINSLQQAIDESLSPMVAKFQNDSTILSGVELEVGKTNVIAHKLGRKLSGWQIIRLRGAATVWDSQDSNGSPSLTLYLHTSDPVTVDLLVF